MKMLGIGAAALVLGMAVGFAPAANAATVLDVTWSGESKSLGTITGAGSGADFYDYGGGTTNGPLMGTLELATAYAFIHESTTTGAFSFGMIFTGANVATPGQTCGLPNGNPDLCRTDFQGYLSGAADSSTVSVKDDGANIFGDMDRSAPGANGFYALLPFTGTTDGFVVDGIQAGDELLMDETRFDNFENIVFVSGTEGSPIFTAFDLTAPDADLLISFVVEQPAPVPLPAGAVLLLSALGLAGALRARKAA